MLPNVGNEREAERNCSSIDSTSTLMTIGSKEEQNFIEKLLFNYNNISLNAWIGLKLNTTLESYEWIDGTERSFINWMDGIPDPKMASPCVQMSLAKLNLGRWTDEPCSHKSLITCQKHQEWNLALLHDAMEQVANDLDDKMLKLEQANSGVPMGFIYVQLPNQTSPEELWSHYGWEDISSNYSGLFFRTLGKDSSTFGSVQEANQKSITNLEVSTRYTNYISQYNHQVVDVNDKGWYPREPSDDTSSRSPYTSTSPRSTTSSDYHYFKTIRFYISDGETRPRNTAIKLWKRIK